MAATPTPSPAAAELERLPQPLRAALGGRSPHLPIAVALSGGADSTALLLAAARLWPGQVRALHIHHGLQEAADDFERHCVALCEALQVPLRSLRVQARHASGESPEDAARRARYAALAHAAREDGAGCVWLGHHADDQVETLLLALSRGAGLPGLAAMPERFEREGVVFERPLLSVPGVLLREWLAQQGVYWVEDPTNEDIAFTRNRIRHQLLPALAQAFPQYRETFARSARHAAQGQALLEQVAREDLLSMGGEPVLTALQGLSRERQANLLRHWLRQVHAASASAAQLDELLDQVQACRTRGHAIRIKVGQGLVLRQDACLLYVPVL